MKDIDLKILEMHNEEEHLGIGVRIKLPYNPAVREPKVAVIFDNGHQTRRIPMIVQTYFPEEDLIKAIVFAKYAYVLEHLFFNEPVNESFTMHLEFTYGEDVYDHIAFELGNDVNFDDVVGYKVSADKEHGVITFKNKRKITPKSRSSAAAEAVKSFITNLWSVILMLICIALLPVFIIDGILALFGANNVIPKNERKGLLFILNHMRFRIGNFSGIKLELTGFKWGVVKLGYRLGTLTSVKENRIVFLSNRRNDLSGNFEYIYDILKKDDKLEFKFVLDNRESKRMSISNAYKYGYYRATSKVALVDDFTPIIYMLPNREKTSLIQLWHACGAFKTFGYSRIGKPGGQRQSNPNHRNYDYAIVSSKEISKFYAEGFGISLDKAVATGIPRTDVFFDKAYAEKIRTEFYGKYPQLKDKKIMLFSPTFRGNGRMTGNYPVDKFDAVKAYESLGGEYAIIIKHHPFVKDRAVIPEKYKDVIIDMSDNSELNDLLFVTDLMITDYSSCIFEASLLDIPMLLYAYDLQHYIATRGFYYEYESFVPGKIVKTFDELMDAVKNKDFETEKIDAFKHRFFDDLDGKSSERTVKLIYSCMEK
ncbi:MAG: CDP-glycerol glycerophosphotransferase family protein [Lachnospiraceae bacterium]|nr:CDP-glycerol glycerophosphotransferase family protein [Lachnospiraceae bacterium]